MRAGASPANAGSAREQTRARAAHPERRRGYRSAPSRRSSASTSTSAPAPSSAGSITSPICARPIRRSATTARRRSTSASAGATARASAPSRTGWRTSSAFFLTRAPGRSLQGARAPDPQATRRAARPGVRRRLGRARPQRVRRDAARAAIRARAAPTTPSTSARSIRRIRRCGSISSATSDLSLASQVGTYLGRAHALQPHAEPRVGPVRGARPARAAGRSGAGRSDERRRPRLLPRHRRCSACGPMRRSCTTTRSGRRSAASRPTGRCGLLLVALRRRDRPAASPIRRRAGRSMRASRGATGCSRHRWRNCSTPRNGGRKVNLVDADIIVDVAPKIVIGDLQAGFSVKLPAGSPAILLNSLRFKDLLQDLVLARFNAAKLDAKYKDILSSGPPARAERGPRAARRHAG